MKKSFARAWSFTRIAALNALVSFGGRSQTVNGVNGYIERRVEPKGHFGAAHIVVNGFGHANCGDSLAEQVAGNTQGAIAANDNKGVQSQFTDAGYDLIGNVFDYFFTISHDATRERVFQAWSRSFAEWGYER